MRNNKKPLGANEDLFRVVNKRQSWAMNIVQRVKNASAWLDDFMDQSIFHGLLVISSFFLLLIIVIFISIQENGWWEVWQSIVETAQSLF